MATVAVECGSQDSPVMRQIARKLWREVSRPFRPKLKPAPAPPPEPAAMYLTGKGALVDGFHPQQATVEEESLPFLRKLVRASHSHSGPIIEIGTLIGITTTTMALEKAPHQKIITVDVYNWNPWGITPDAHEALTRQILRYLIETGQVEQVRMDKNEFYRTYSGPAPSLVFLDAVHDYEETKKDIEWSQRVGAKIIAGHDYHDVYPGVQQVVQEFGGPRELCGTVWAL